MKHASQGLIIPDWVTQVSVSDDLRPKAPCEPGVDRITKYSPLPIRHYDHWHLVQFVTMQCSAGKTCILVFTWMLFWHLLKHFCRLPALLYTEQVNVSLQSGLDSDLWLKTNYMLNFCVEETNLLDDWKMQSSLKIFWSFQNQTFNMLY